MIDLHDFPEYSNIPMITMEDNPNGDLPVFFRRYHSDNVTLYLHRHRFVQINYIMQGKVKHIVHNTEFEIGAGDVFVIPPFIPHRLEPVDGQDFEIAELEFEPEFVLGTANLKSFDSFFDFAYLEPFLVCEGEVKPRLHISGKNQLIVEELLEAIKKEYTGETENYLLAIKADLLKLLVYLGRWFKADMANSLEGEVLECHKEAIDRAMEYIDNHFAEDLKVEEVAKIALLSRSYFCYLFKALTGETFIEYLNLLRVAKAEYLLKATRRTVTDICFASGFHSISHFNRVFKGVHDLAPRQYRQCHSISRQAVKD